MTAQENTYYQTCGEEKQIKHLPQDTNGPNKGGQQIRLDTMATSTETSLSGGPSTMITATSGRMDDSTATVNPQVALVNIICNTKTLPLGWPVEYTHTVPRFLKLSPQILCKPSGTVATLPDDCTWVSLKNISNVLDAIKGMQPHCKKHTQLQTWEEFVSNLPKNKNGCSNT